VRNTSVNRGLLHPTVHSASYFTLSRSLGDDAKIVDLCNPYFPTPEMFAKIGGKLKRILKNSDSNGEHSSTDYSRLDYPSGEHSSVDYRQSEPEGDSAIVLMHPTSHLAGHRRGGMSSAG
jgi:hypothetical protein